MKQKSLFSFFSQTPRKEKNDELGSDNYLNFSQTPKTDSATPKEISALSSFKLSSDAKALNASPALKESPANAIHSVVNIVQDTPSKRPLSATPTISAKKAKLANDERYHWLVDVRDKNKNTPNSPDYNPKTLYIPPSALAKLTDFERQFWEIKSNYFDTVVFFKKGKFYELYENDADIGHKEFDLKMTDRVNMRMVGVPESSFEHWAAQFVAKGYKVAQVNQLENCISKSMREKQDKSSNKVIRRELTCILTQGTLVDPAMLPDDANSYCIAIRQLGQQYGVAIVDASIGEFRLCHLDSDSTTKLETLLYQLKPKELIFEKGNLSAETTKLIKNTLTKVQLTPMMASEWWDADRTISELRAEKYRLQNPSKILENDPLVLHALGGLVAYLVILKLDEQLVSINDFDIYNPIQQSKSLVLDGQTLSNLEIFLNSQGGTEGTLFALLNQCVTPFGKRLFKQWVCHPLNDVDKINSRLDAVDAVSEMGGLCEDLKEQLSKLPDLERLVSRIHAGTCRVKDFVLVINGFKLIFNLIDENSVYLQEKLARIFVDCSSLTSFFDELDNSIIIEGDSLMAKPGFDQELDKCDSKVAEIEQRFNDYLQEQSKELGCSKLEYKDIGKEIYQLQVPAGVKVPKSWVQMSKTQQVVRYWTSEIREMVTEIQEARELREAALRKVKANVYEKFDLKYFDLCLLIDKMAELDCLLSLAKWKRLSNGCRPEFVQEERVLELQEMSHPCLSASAVIPNDISFENTRMILLSGPNMGGKSTLLRQSCIAIIMAQLGCYLPAKSCKMSIFDRIYTRIGANDDIMAGQSTFMVELSETCKILKDATSRSFVILDELGRGTSTFDGYAIAFSVLKYLISHVQCLGLFSTHYSMLNREFQNNSLVKCMFMSFQEAGDRIVFLYKLVPGACPKSYGMNVAALAGIPDQIIKRATEVAAEFESNCGLKDVKIRETGLNLSALYDFVVINESDRVALAIRQALSTCM